jgi:hypothetical protein
MSYEIAELNTKDLGGVFDLTIESGLNAGQSKQDWIKTQLWLLGDSKVNTGIAAPLGHVMYKAGKLIGFVGYSQRLFKCDGEISPAIVLNELVVHPEHRGIAGIMLCKHTLRYFENDFENWKILGLHHSRDAAALWEALGSKAVPNTGLTFTTVVSAAAFLSLRLPHLRPLFQTLQSLGCTPVVNAMLARAGKPVISNGALTMRHCTAQDILAPGNGEATRLINSFSETYETGVMRGSTYLQWRYADHPLRQFHWYVLRDRERLRAIAVAHRRQDGTAALCDLIVEPADVASSFEEILRAALFACGGEGSPIVRSKMLMPAGIQAFRAMAVSEEEKEYNQFWVSPPPATVEKPLYTFGDNKLF